jgi:glycosyltransferase involved in cell wall biosynthesis
MVFFSVIIPNYNHGQFLKRRIDSVLNQTYQNFELIILDDASTDESEVIINNYKYHPKISHIIFNQDNSGSPFKQWEKGIELAKAEWIWIAESDDEATPQFLESAVIVIDKHPDLGIFFTNSVYESMMEIQDSYETTASLNNYLFHTKKWDSDYINNGRNEIIDYLSRFNSINNASSVIMRRNALLLILPQFKKIKYFGDWFAYIHLAIQYDVSYNHLPLNRYRRHKASLLNKECPGWERKRDYFIIFNYLHSLPFIVNKEALSRFHILKYLNFGRADHFSSIMKTIRSYFGINPLLAAKVVMNILFYKIKGIKEP